MAAAGLRGIHPNLGTEGREGRGGVGLENLDLFKCAAHCDKGVVGLSRLFLLGGAPEQVQVGGKILPSFVFQSKPLLHLGHISSLNSGNKGFQVRLFGQC